MGFFDDDPFDEIVREFFGGPSQFKGRRETRIRDEENIIDFIEDDHKVFVIFELPGFNEKDITININGRDLEIKARKKDHESIQEYMKERLKQGIFLKKSLPSLVDPKSFKHTMHNGILEVTFNKK